MKNMLWSSICAAVTLYIVAGLHSYAHAAYQDVSLVPSQLSLSVANEYEVSLVYDASDGDSATEGIAVRVHYDSSSLHFLDFHGILETDFLDHTGPIYDEADYDGDPATDIYVVIFWWVTNGNWPNRGLPTELAKVRFLSLANGPTAIRVSILCGDPAYTDPDGEAIADCAELVWEEVLDEVVETILEGVGRVIDALENGIGDAAIEADWAAAGTTTSEDGYFILSIPGGSHTLEVSKAGYATKIITFDECDSCLYSIGDITLEALGDLNADAKCDLADTILSIRALTENDTTDLIRPDYGASGVDISGDGRIGLAEVVYSMQMAAAAGN